MRIAELHHSVGLGGTRELTMLTTAGVSDAAGLGTTVGEIQS